MRAELDQSSTIERSGARAALPAIVLAKIRLDNLRDVDLGEGHCGTIDHGLRLVVESVDEAAHPLVSRAVCIDGTTGLSSCLDLDTFRSGLGRVVGVFPLNDQIGMAIVILILDESTRVLRDALGQHVGDQAGHSGGSEHVVESSQSLRREQVVHVVEEIVDVLHGHLEVPGAERVGQLQRGVEFGRVYDLADYRHAPIVIPAADAPSPLPATLWAGR